MHHPTPLIAMIAAGLALAFVMGVIAHRLRISPLVGYLLAGVVVGPFTPGFVGDAALAGELAEIGVILLMFGVGLHFSLKDLLSVRMIAIPGAIAQMATATLMGMGLGWAFGWGWPAGLVFGLSLSVASTVVLLRSLQERRILQTERGRIAVGWLIVEDLAMVIALVLLPVLAQSINGVDGAAGPVWMVLAKTLGKVVAFVAFMLIIGRRVIPFILHYTAHTGSRELFRLAVLAVALGVAFGASILFGVSFALGAFFAGMVLAESELSHRAAEETLPLRDAFAVLFFVSVGMLFNPAVVVERPLPLLATVAVILVGKSIAAFVIIRLFRHSVATALTVSASLAQIGEFSFILAGLGVALGLLPEAGRDLILAAAIISILLNPLVFGLVARFITPPAAAVSAPAAAAQPEPEEETDLVPTLLTAHAVVVGYGRVGRVIASGVQEAGMPVLILEDDIARAERARADGWEVVVGNAADPAVLAAVALPQAALLFVAIPNGFEAGQVVEQARLASPALRIIARSHSDEEMTYLREKGADGIVMGERELAMGMLDLALHPRPEAETAAL